MEYSAVSQPPGTFWNFIQFGTVSSIIALQMTRVFPAATSTEPVECGAISGVKESGRSWSVWRPSWRGISRQRRERVRNEGSVKCRHDGGFKIEILRGALPGASSGQLRIFQT